MARLRSLFGELAALGGDAPDVLVDLRIGGGGQPLVLPWGHNGVAAVLTHGREWVRYLLASTAPCPGVAADDLPGQLSTLFGGDWSTLPGPHPDDDRAVSDLVAARLAADTFVARLVRSAFVAGRQMAGAGIHG